MRGLRLLVVGGFGLAALVPAAPAIGQSDASGGAGYDFYNLHTLADGATASFNLKGFLPIEGLVGLSSITSESHYGVGRSDALSALPNPGDLILTLPGTLSALLGISGLPNYPAAVMADVNSAPVADLQLVPDLNLGAGHLHADASDTSSGATTYVGDQVNTVGLIPAFEIGSIKTTARTDKVNDTTYEAVGTTTVSDLRLLGGLVRISQITSEVTASIQNDKPTASVSNLTISGATVAGQAVGITDKGIVAPGASTALAPILDTLLKPLTTQGIKVRTIPADTTIGARTATAEGAALEIEVPVSVEGYPGVFDLTLGRALAELQVGPLRDDSATSAGAGTTDVGTGSSVGDGSSLGSVLPGLGDSSSFAPGLPSTPALAAPASRAAGTETISVPVRRTVADWDVTTLYRVLLLGGLALFAAGQIIVRSTFQPRRRPNDLRQLWRW